MNNDWAKGKLKEIVELKDAQYKEGLLAESVIEVLERNIEGVTLIKTDEIDIDKLESVSYSYTSFLFILIKKFISKLITENNNLDYENLRHLLKSDKEIKEVVATIDKRLEFGHQLKNSNKETVISFELISLVLEDKITIKAIPRVRVNTILFETNVCL